MSIQSVNERLRESALGRFTLWGSARTIGITIAFVIWAYLASIFPRELLPGPIETVQLMWGIIISGQAWVHLGATFTAIIFAFTGAMILGSTFGILMGSSEFGTNFFTPFVNVGLAIPGLAWAATFFIIFTYDELLGIVGLTPFLTGMMAATGYLAINIWKGVESIDHDLVQMSDAFNISRFRLLKRVILPNVAPELFAAFRFGIAITWKVVTVAEMFAAEFGIGYKLMQQYQLYRYESAWAWAAVFMLIILVIEYGFLRPLENIVFEYRQDAELNRIGQ